jgi:hypothetical protein
MLNALALEIDFPIFNRISSFYDLLTITPKHAWIKNKKGGLNNIIKRVLFFMKIPTYVEGNSRTCNEG